MADWTGRWFRGERDDVPFRAVVKKTCNGDCWDVREFFVFGWEDAGRRSLHKYYMVGIAQLG